jgi:hypothetical protein
LKPKTEKILATLVRGQTYILVDRNGGKDLHFLQGKPLQVTPAQRDHLILHAVDCVTVRDQWASDEGNGGARGMDVQKFAFVTGTTETTEPAIAA